MKTWLSATARGLAYIQTRWIDRLQGELVLPTARTLYLAGAFAALAAAVLALLAVIFFQLSSLRPLPSVPAAPTSTAALGPIPLGMVDARLSPPTGLRFVVAPEPIRGLLTDHTILGHFEADTPNGLASAPDDFQVLGGRDVALFLQDVAEVRTGGVVRSGTVLRAAPGLVDQINAVLPSLTANRTRNFQLRVTAMDANGNNAPPIDLQFTIAYGPAPAAPAADAAPAPAVAAVDDSALARLAREIALVVDPQRTDVFFDAAERARGIPEVCEAGQELDRFVVEYRRAFDHVKPKLTAANVNGFYAGVCDAWRSGVEARNQAQAQSQAEWRERAAKAEVARAVTMGKKLLAKTLRNAAFMFMVGCLSAFLTIALLLAFLAIEGHSKAVREVVEVLARGQQARRTAE